MERSTRIHLLGTAWILLGLVQVALAAIGGAHRLFGVFGALNVLLGAAFAYVELYRTGG